MKSNLKKIIVFDLETGGLKSEINQITEFAGVVIDLETLEIVDEMSIMLEPKVFLSKMFDYDMDIMQEARLLFKELSVKDADTNKKTLYVGEDMITPISIERLCPYIEQLAEVVRSVSIPSELTHKDIEEAKAKFPNLSNILDVYFNLTYNPIALQVTHMSKDLLLKEGVDHFEATKKIEQFINSHKVGNSKPILAGHNIKNFDIPFLDALFLEHGVDRSAITNSLMMDTLEMARLRWIDMPSYSLGVCANEVGLTLKEAHRALPDTIANAKFLVKLLKTFRGEGAVEQTYTRKKFNFNF